MAKKDDRMYNITPEILRNIAGAPVSKNIVENIVIEELTKFYKSKK
jgi:hypothetical protein